MPLVFAHSEVTESGHQYDDALGGHYEYPTRYRALVTPGVAFVYYRGRRRSGGHSRTPDYIGCGRVGPIEPSGDGLLGCAVTNFHPFDPTIDFTDAHGYLEPEAFRYGDNVGLYFRSGVREITASTLKNILRLAGLDVAAIMEDGN